MGLVEWHDYFAAMAGCAATLTGLLFVSLSIGLKTILEYPMLPSVAQRSLLLVTILLVAGFCLLPGQSVALVGAELLGMGLLSWGVITWLSVRNWRHTPPQYKSIKPCCSPSWQRCPTWWPGAGYYSPAQAGSTG